MWIFENRISGWRAMNHSAAPVLSGHSSLAASARSFCGQIEGDASKGDFTRGGLITMSPSRVQRAWNAFGCSARVLVSDIRQLVFNRPVEC